jgi:hypothetical protein
MLQTHVVGRAVADSDWYMGAAVALLQSAAAWCYSKGAQARHAARKPVAYVHCHGMHWLMLVH